MIQIVKFKDFVEADAAARAIGAAQEAGSDVAACIGEAPRTLAVGPARDVRAYRRELAAMKRSG
jgi:hypothetical protein